MNRVMRTKRARGIRFLLIFCAIGFVACDPGPDTSLIRKTVDDFHGRIAQGNDQLLYDATDSDFRKVTSASDFKSLLHSIRTLGAVRDTERKSATRSWAPFRESIVTATFLTTLENGKAEERFVWRERGGQLVLLGYHFQSLRKTP